MNRTPTAREIAGVLCAFALLGIIWIAFGGKW